MPVDRGLWKRGLDRTSAPPWPCPRCSRGTLRLQRDTLDFAETALSKPGDSDEGFSLLDIEYAFSALLKCDACKNAVSCCGTGGYTVEDYHDPEGNAYEYVEFFAADYFSQPMPLLRLDRRWPKAIREQLNLSFLVFFCDLGAAANHVRSCIEAMLTEREIPVVTKKGLRLSLQERIKSFKEIDAENAERAEALKWIGNIGSHGGTLTRQELFDAYDILEWLLEDVYIGHYRSLKKKVEEINQAKGVRN